ncbi:MAG: thiazole synthase [Planctomycetota bacterium]|nr:thiazole synthase [Planctomycetota bacterium]
MGTRVKTGDLVIAGKSFSSRLFVGTGKFSSLADMKAAIENSGTEMVTVALRRVDIANPRDDLLAAIDRKKIQLLPNTSGARDAGEALRIAGLAREASGVDWLKLEITPDPYYLLPDPLETFKAAKQLVKEGFVVLPYVNADPILCRRLEEAGCAAVMPLGSPIGTNQGLRTRSGLEIIIEQCRCPVVVDAGIGLPSQAADAIEMGADAVLVNTALAVAENPAAMAEAFKLAVRAARLAVEAGPGETRRMAEASSPLTGFLG